MELVKLLKSANPKSSEKSGKILKQLLLHDEQHEFVFGRGWHFPRNLEQKKPKDPDMS